MTPDVIFTQTHAEKLAVMDEKLDGISDDVKELKEYWGACYGKLNADVLDIQLHGSERVKSVEFRILDLEKRQIALKEQIDFERGRLAMLFIGVGAAISAIISWLVSHFGSN